MKKILPFIVLCLTFNAFGQKQSSLWSGTKHQIIPSLEGQRYLYPVKFRTLKLNESRMVESLAEATNVDPVEIILPMPNGDSKVFSVLKTMVMPRALAVKYPKIKTYTGRNGLSMVKLDVTEEGFHAMILGEKGGTVFIDPYAKGNTAYYISYYKHDYIRLDDDHFECEVQNVVNEQYIDPLFNGRMVGDCQLRTYTLALACTGEYAQYHGGTVSGAMSAMNTTMNRCNGVYERDLGFTLEFVSNDDDLIFLDANSDPYTNNSGSTMLNENQTTCDNVIGSSNYDIGHVFSTGGGGIAQLVSVCGGGKARGVTGSSNPVGDAFDIDYVVHEMGHQFGANHTQNNSCNNAGPAGVEPGSASTIMGYAGICSPNVQNHSDDYYNAYNLNEIANYMVYGNGNSCADVSSNGNNAPVISVTNNSYNIPYSTPFKLTASGTDSDGDILTYCWEQQDATQATMPPVGTSTDGPLFRSLNPTTSPTRYFLNLVDLFANTDPTWEELPAVNRSMHFRCTLRDNHMGLGCTDETDVTVNVANSGPFRVTTANAPTAWIGASMETVTWDLGGSTANPINCNYVNILLWEEGGASDPIMIEEHVPNSGTATIMVPNITGNNYRLLIEAYDNIFFDISDANISIEEQLVPSYFVSGIQSNYSACIEDTLIITYTINSIAGFNELVDAYISLNDNDVEIIGLPTQVLPGTHSFLVIPNVNTDNSIFLVFHSSYNGTPTSTGFAIEFENFPGVPSPEMPLDGSTGIGNSVELSWSDTNSSGNVNVLVDTSPDFQNATSYSSGSNTKTISGLEGSTVYYWRVRGHNGCGYSDFSPTFAFQTGGTGCVDYSGTPGILISDSGPSQISFSPNETFEITQATLYLDISHTFIGDLSCSIVHNGDNFEVFNRPGVPASNFGCDGEDIIVTFDDVNGDLYDEFEATCNPNPPSISGVFMSLDGNLSNIAGTNANGIYTIEIFDDINQDDGIFNAYTLTLCYDEEVSNQLVLENNNVLNYNAGSQTVLPTANLLSTEQDVLHENITYILLRLPVNGNINLNGTVLALGDTFTQLDVDNGNLSYESIDMDALMDDMLLDVYSPTGSWLHNVEFVFEVGTAVLSISIEDQTNLGCYGDASGSVTLSGSNGTPPYMYSMNGADFQMSPEFTGLSAGMFTFYIQDATDLIVSTTLEITEPSEIIISAVVIDGEVVTNTAGGVGELSTQINGDIVNGETINISVTDDNDCSNDIDFLVHIIDPVLSASGPACHQDDFSGGSVTFNPTDGVEPYTYSLDGEGFEDTNTFDNLTEGTHTATIMDSEGNQTSTTFDIVNPTLLTMTSSLDVNQVTINATGGIAPYMYSANGIDFVEDNVLDLPDGVYTLTTMDALGCTTTEELIVSDTKELDNFKSNISFYPNPSSGYFEINFGQINEDVNIQVYNVVGQLIYQEHINTQIQNKRAIHLNVADGVYEVVISTESIVYPQKIVIL